MKPIVNIQETPGEQPMTKTVRRVRNKRQSLAEIVAICNAGPDDMREAIHDPLRAAVAALVGLAIPEGVVLPEIRQTLRVLEDLLPIRAERAYTLGELLAALYDTSGTHYVRRDV